MRRPISLLVFPVVAATAVLSSLARIVSGSSAPADIRDLLDLVAICSTFGAHVTAQEYLESCRTRIRSRVETEGLPAWVGAQAEKNCWKAIPHLWVGYLLPGLVMWSWASGHKGLVSGAWFDGLLAFNLTFQVGAFVGEYAVMTAQTRLWRDVGGWVKKPDAGLVDSVA